MWPTTNVYTVHWTQKRHYDHLTEKKNTISLTASWWSSDSQSFVDQTRNRPFERVPRVQLVYLSEYNSNIFYHKLHNLDICKSFRQLKVIYSYKNVHMAVVKRQALKLILGALLRRSKDFASPSEAIRLYLSTSSGYSITLCV